MRILHAADLHLTHKSDRDYSLGVLHEVVQIALDEAADILVFSGDVFDTFESMEQLRASVRDAVARLEGRLPIYMIPGNHEDLGRTTQDLSAFDLGQIRLLTAKPFSLETVNTPKGCVEILAIPHQNEAFDYRHWPVPIKQAPFRIAMAHGSVQGMSYVGPDVEEGGASLDPDMFDRFQVSYAALGHIHGRREERRGTTLIAYPGSARVWRSGEVGERSVNMVELNRLQNGSASVKPIPLSKAGMYRFLDVPIQVDGSLPTIDRQSWSRHDFIELRLSGLTEDEHAVKAACEAFELAHRASVRRLIIKRDDIIVLAGIAHQPLAQKFLELWEKSYPEDGSAPNTVLIRQRLIWRRARELALLEMKNLLEGA